jgi:hypothetical protein
MQPACAIHQDGAAVLQVLEAVAGRQGGDAAAGGEGEGSKKPKDYHLPGPARFGAVVRDDTRIDCISGGAGPSVAFQADPTRADHAAPLTEDGPTRWGKRRPWESPGWPGRGNGWLGPLKGFCLKPCNCMVKGGEGFEGCPP